MKREKVDGLLVEDLVLDSDSDYVTDFKNI